ncbi:hypothetical protein WJX74_007321 [Apatococcus lobatus]|uniref:cyclic pyranopterin monophosphate synthase n=1 Tax=Apatococcus lobatus TaxID=904363 RepID=A0AAW1RSI2_9CHLO
MGSWPYRGLRELTSGLLKEACPQLQGWLCAARKSAKALQLSELAAAKYSTGSGPSDWPGSAPAEPLTPDNSDNLDTFNRELNDVFEVASSHEEPRSHPQQQPRSHSLWQADTAPDRSAQHISRQVQYPSEAPGRLSHLDHQGSAQMVDVGEKEVTRRTATAQMRVQLSHEVFREVMNPRHLKKGNVIETARIAGIMAAKHTPTLIPMCHTVPLDKVQLEIKPCEQAAEPGQTELEITATASATHRTGVEMEALTAAAAAGLTVYDMCKAMDHGIVLNGLQLVHKAGGKTGTWTHSDR